MNQTFTVTGMTCGHCEMAVKRALKQVDPQAEVIIDRTQNLVQVTRPSRASPWPRPSSKRVMPSPPEPRAPAARPAFPVNIGQAAARSGVSAKMLRHYESLGLLGRVTRTDSGYRQYSEADVHTLRFIKRSRDMGFSMAEIAELVNLWHDRQPRQRQCQGHRAKTP